MIFKKKYKRSEWFEGLLECEKLYSEDYAYHKNDGIRMWFKSRTLTDFSEESGFIHSYIAYKINDPRCIGIMDYLNYMENKPKGEQ